MWLRLAAVTTLVACVTSSHAPPAPPRHTELGLAISELKLSNGLRVVLVRDPKATEVQVTSRYRVGAVDDPAGQDGVAHLVEHLMFQQVVGGRSIFAHLEDDASRLDGHTDLDTTVYSARSTADHLDELLSFDAIRIGLRCTSITDQVFEREREVVVNEVRLRDEATRLWAAVTASVYPEGHAYRHLGADTVETVAAITRAQACKFADEHYTPSNAVIVVSGALEIPRLEASVSRVLGHLSTRAAAPQVAAASVANGGRELTAPAPVDDDALLVAWPLPEDLKLRARVRAVAWVAQRLVDGSIGGRVDLVELGDARAPVLALFVEPSLLETFEHARANAERALNEVPLVFSGSGFAKFDAFAYELTKQTAIADLFRTLEDGSGRDERLAGYALAGRDPRIAIEEEMRGLRDMSRGDAEQVARTFLSYTRATVVTLKQGGPKRRGHGSHLAPPIDELGERRDPPDPELAHAPAADAVDRSGVAAMRTRTLANGMHVVLLPVSSVPTVDVRLVFDAGTADEAPGARGAALVAGEALSWGPSDSEDAVLFMAAGGRLGVDVVADRTTFTARGLDMHVDLLLTGLARYVRGGIYEPSTEAAMSAWHRQAKKQSDDGSLTDAWRAALYGPQHPYVEAGLARHISATLGVPDAEQFRRDHYAPANATLVVAGRFDAALVDRWIDYLFADWRGMAGGRAQARAVLDAKSLARADDTSELWLEIAAPATGGGTAARLVAAEMLSNVAGEVRHELGASYTLSAALDEERLAARYELIGAVDPARGADALALVRDRVAKLRADPDASARAFVTARRRVLARLTAVVGSASGLAQRVEHDVALGRAAMSDFAVAEAVRSLTLEAMGPALADLDLAHAAVMMRGPEADVRRAFAALGREPTFFASTATAPKVSRVVDDETPGGDASTALGERAPPPAKAKAKPVPIAVVVAPGYTASSISDHSASGLTLAADVGYTSDPRSSIGVHFAFGRVSGSYRQQLSPVQFLPHAFDLTPIDLGFYARGVAFERVWGEISFGLHADFYSEAMQATTVTGLGATVQAGVDLYELGPHKLGVYSRLDGELEGEAAYSAFTLGLAYRR